jgi:hypothetical protein
MDESILSAPLYFEAAVQRKLLLKDSLVGGHTDDDEITVEVVVTSERLDVYDVVIDFRELETAIDEQLLLFHGNLPDNFDVSAMLVVAAKLVKDITPMVPVCAKIMEISFIYSCGRRIRCVPS